MNGQNTDLVNHRAAAGAAIAGIVLAILFSTPDGAAVQGWNHFGGSARVGLDILRAVIPAGWQLVPWYLREEAGCLQPLLQIVACAWDLILVVAG